jgi:NAD(P)-dependent dehydrogenase (short-subunit alcohol dehydrogenase family)
MGFDAGIQTVKADSLLDFSGRRVLITGAANGFGEAIARKFHAHGASLLLADIESDRVQSLATELGAKGYEFDQSDPVSVDRLCQMVGEVDVLVNNAGILIAKPLLSMSVQDVQALVATDFVGVWQLMRGVGEGMVSRKSGVILSIGSQTAFCGGENRGIYAAMKAAVSQLTRAAAVEWGPQGVRVVCLAPGRSLTRMTQTTAAPTYKADRGLERVPLGRWGSAEEVANMALFLCSDAASYVTGETLIADGGYVLG